MKHSPPATEMEEKELWQPGLWLGFLWGFAEGTLFFIIPDVLLSWAALTGYKCSAKILGAILAGALVAGACMYTWALKDPVQSHAVVAAVPFVPEKMFDTVREGYAAHGVSELLQGPGSGIPYKVYAVLAPPVAGPIPFLATSILARLERFALSWLIATALGWFLHRWIRRHRKITVILFAAFWVGTYAVYWSWVLNGK